MKKSFFALILTLSLSPVVFAQGTVQFDSLYLAGEAIQTIKNPELEEISGLVFSQKHKNLIYVQVDSGGEPAVFMLDSLGNELGRITLLATKNRDWEDIALGPGPAGRPYIYVGEIGDNGGIHPEIFIYRFPEPDKVQPRIHVEPEVLKLNYPGGARDAETLMVDPISGDLFIVSKRDEKNTLYRVPQTAFSKGEAILEELNQFDFSNSVAGDISSDGSKILIKNYFGIFYWDRAKGESVPEALKKTPLRLPYVPEPQGEAIGFTTDGSVFYTISEKRFNIKPILYRYPKN